jgi:hypothetical protein
MKVILEIVRLANIVPGIFRKALQDIEFKGTYIYRIINTMILLNREYFLFLGKLRKHGCRLHHTGRLGSDGVSSSSALKPRNLRRSIGV